MQAENVIEVKNVKKHFRVYKDKGSSLKEKVLFRERNQYEVRSVLRGISFEIKKGEAVGLIGHNGCGKSTTLKLLTKIMYPDSGTIEVKGRVSSLLELGAGFHPDMSGRDNIFINASIFGLSRKEIAARLDDIIEFSELGDYIDNPVRTYSSGMYMRLAFSVAINVMADVLLIDEILAVGDSSFQQKCFDKLKEIKAQGTTIVIVSHSLSQIENFCDRSIWLNEGLIEADGSPHSVHGRYNAFMQEYSFEKSAAPDAQVEESAAPAEDEAAAPGLVLEKVYLADSNGIERAEFKAGDPVKLKIKYRVLRPFEGNILFLILRRDGVQCFVSDYKMQNGKLTAFKEETERTIVIPDLNLVTNSYRICLIIEDKNGNEVGAYYTSEFYVEDPLKQPGVFRMEHFW